MQINKLRARTAILLDLIPLDPVSYLKVDTGLNYGIGSMQLIICSGVLLNPFTKLPRASNFDGALLNFLTGQDADLLTEHMKC